jgi:hypothetical protein
MGKDRLRKLNSRGNSLGPSPHLPPLLPQLPHSLLSPFLTHTTHKEVTDTVIEQLNNSVTAFGTSRIFDFGEAEGKTVHQRLNIWTYSSWHSCY